MMKRLILITHDTLADAYLDTLHNFLADTTFIRCINVDAKSSLEAVQKRLLEEWNETDTFLVLSELSIASSTKVAVDAAKGKSNMYVISGLNMLMLIQFAIQPLEADMDAYIKRITADAQADIRYWKQ